MVKYYKNQTIQVLFADGTVSTKLLNGNWQTVDKNGNGSATPIRSVSEKKYPSTVELIQRDDGVTIETQEEPWMARSRHSDGTSISSSATRSKITTADGFSISFDLMNGKQEVSFEDWVISKEIIEGKTKNLLIHKHNKPSSL